MCGICGVWRREHGSRVERGELLRMTAALAHRGPDGVGVHLDRSLGLGARRLAVIDRSDAGAQPMSSPDGRFTLVYNGEIYNHRELRPALEAAGHRFRGGADTETLLHLWMEHGPGCLRLLRGMFAFAIWDRDEERLFLARDRFGQKPLFYLEGGATFAFASEIKSLLRLREVQPTVDPVAIHHFLSFDYVPGPATAFTGIVKLPAACWLEVDRRGVRVERYWRLSFTPRRPVPDPDEAAAAVVEKLEESLRLQLMSDVPLGLLLSGGIDSTALLALLAEIGPSRVETFTVAFPGRNEDESAQARASAEQFGAVHHELPVEPDLATLLPSIVDHYDDLFGDTSALPTWCLAREASRHITVALGGDGGDELFAGYDRYRDSRAAELFGRAPRAARAAAGAAARVLPAGVSPRHSLGRARRFLLSQPETAERLFARLALHFDGTRKREIYSGGFAADVAARGAADSEALLAARVAESGAPDFLARCLDADVATYLPDDILYKVDVASMAHSLEVRAPFLDHELAELVASLPSSYKLRGLTTKWLLRRALRDRLPAPVVRGRKRGFGLPVADWIGGELAELVRDTLLSRRALERGYFEARAIERLIDDQAAGRERLEYHLWNLLVLELWHRSHVDAAF